MNQWRVKTAVIFLMLLFLLLTWDILRPAENQWVSWIYVRWVVVYQTNFRKSVNDSIQCRFIPTCSEYSIVAVRQHGLLGGLRLTTRRLISCQSSVPKNSPDPVPP